jgi:hypothetical protein
MRRKIRKKTAHNEIFAAQKRARRKFLPNFAQRKVNGKGTLTPSIQQND